MRHSDKILLVLSNLGAETEDSIPYEQLFVQAFKER